MFDSLVLKLQDTETETLKTHYIHVYKMFGWKFWLVYMQKRSTEGSSKPKSLERRQVQERLVSTLEHMQVPKWDRTRCPEEYILGKKSQLACEKLCMRRHQTSIAYGQKMNPSLQCKSYKVFHF